VFTVRYDLTLHAVYTNLMTEGDESTEIFGNDFSALNDKINKFNG
jgi:hypothetical protein